MKPRVEKGARYGWTRKITEEDIRRFTEISQDRGRHHLNKDEQGRLLAQGLLAATMATKLGGDLNFIARRMIFDFVKPVYAGDELECAASVDLAMRKPGRLKVEFSFEIRNQDGEVVLTGSSSGVILDAGA